MPIVLKIAVPVPVPGVFDYLPPPSVDLDRLRPGVRVEVPFGRRRKIGLLLSVASSSALDPGRLREAVAVLDEAPLFAAVDLELLVWASRYYHYPVGEAIAAACAALRHGGSANRPVGRRLCLTRPADPEGEHAVRRAPRQAALWQLLQEAPEGVAEEALSKLAWDFRPAAKALIGKGLAHWREEAVEDPCPGPVAESPAPPLTPHQEAAVAAVTAALGGFRAFLLEGVTGSGKTEVYLRLAGEVLARGGQVMVLLPEISLTPQLEARFRARFNAPVAVFHSGLSAAERQRAWLGLQSGRVAVLLGTRSAVFTPMRSPGLIVLDEEHDASFKQQDGFRFSARDVAVKRASLLNIPVVLGSATPSLESLVNVQQGRYQWLNLPERAGGAAPPEFRLLDIRGQRLVEGLSARLTAAIAETLARREQALLFVNRRGFAPTLMCHACGWVAKCRLCDANLVIHAGDGCLRCHHCGYQQPLVGVCGACGDRELHPLGLGTERIEAALAELFPAARVVRIDRDSMRRKGQLQRSLEDIQAGRVDILIGTQMLAKGHHFPQVTLVGILDLDASLFSTDFRSSERAAQLIVQVAGRAGREQRPGTVLLQTRHPDHPLLQVLVREGYPGFARACARERQTAALPPFAHQALWRAESRSAEAASEFLAALAERALRLPAPAPQVFGPAPAPLARRAGRHRWQLLFQSERRAVLHAALDRLLGVAAELGATRRVRWSIDIDPVDLY
ncbi:primosomal protein N' [Candidatus Methylocalor cossyra]|uniref:Replication restart protein PriA n=1 Tax=Candidatus Methylocalor cossyra TaxID=3108543 RepID=A0ABM9NM09_9GAMM